LLRKTRSEGEMNFEEMDNSSNGGLDKEKEIQSGEKQVKKIEAGEFGCTDLQPEKTPVYTQMIKGRLYDLRCIFCKVLPRKDKPRRSELYRHYAQKHFLQELNDDYGHPRLCPFCDFEPTFEEGRRQSTILGHIGQVHAKVENYLPDEAKIPTLMKYPGRCKKEKGVACGGQRHWSEEPKANVLSPLSEGSFTQGMANGIVSVEKEEHAIHRMDGFTIEDEVVEEAEEWGPAHLEANLVCSICGLMFKAETSMQAVKHMQEKHGVKGLRHLALAVMRLVSSGLLIKNSVD